MFCVQCLQSIDKNINLEFQKLKESTLSISEQVASRSHLEASSSESKSSSRFLLIQEITTDMSSTTFPSTSNHLFQPVNKKCLIWFEMKSLFWLHDWKHNLEIIYKLVITDLGQALGGFLCFFRAIGSDHIHRFLRLDKLPHSVGA